MSYALRLHPLVKQDYNKAFKWYEDKQKGLGDRFIKAVRNKIEEIIRQPEVYSSRDVKKFMEAKVDVFPYLIVYKISREKKKYTSVLFTILKNIREKNTRKNKYLL